VDCSDQTIDVTVGDRECGFRSRRFDATADEQSGKDK
jgi:hypothetical protein